MANAKEIQNRMKSIRDTMKITNAMYMISSSKLKRARKALADTDVYKRQPLSNLDAKLRVQMRAEISKLHQRLGATMIYVTHDQTEAMTLGTRIVVMKDGIVQQIDTPKNLYDAPANLFVAGFIGSPRMNILEAVCLRSKEKEKRAELLFCGSRILLPEEKSEKLLKMLSLIHI